MKLQIIGIEVSEGTSSKTNKAYSIAQLHTMAELAPSRGGDNVAKGFMGTTYRCDAGLVRKVQHLSFPLMVEADIRPVMQFGKREDVVFDLHPVELVKKPA